MGSAISLDQPPHHSIPSASATWTSVVVATNDRHGSVGAGTQLQQNGSAQGSILPPQPLLATTALSSPPQQPQHVFPPLDEVSQEEQDDPASPQQFPQQQPPWTMKKRRHDDHFAVATAPEAAATASTVGTVGRLDSATITTAAEEQCNDLQSPASRTLVREDGHSEKSPAAAATTKNVVDDFENGSPRVSAMPPSILLSPRSETIEKCASCNVAHQLTSFERKVPNDDNEDVVGAAAEVAEAKRTRTSVTFSVTAEVVLSRKSSDAADEVPRQQSTTVTVVSENCPHKAQRAKPRAKASKRGTEATRANRHEAT